MIEHVLCISDSFLARPSLIPKFFKLSSFLLISRRVRRLHDKNTSRDDIFSRLCSLNYLFGFSIFCFVTSSQLPVQSISPQVKQPWTLFLQQDALEQSTGETELPAKLTALDDHIAVTCLRDQEPLVRLDAGSLE